MSSRVDELLGYTKYLKAAKIEDEKEAKEKAEALKQQSAEIASRLDGGNYATNTGKQQALVEDEKAAEELQTAAQEAKKTVPQAEKAAVVQKWRDDQKSAQAAANLDNSLMTQATRDTQREYFDRAMESLYNQMEIAKSAQQTEKYESAQEKYSNIAGMVQRLENPASTAAYATNWEEQRRNEIMSTDDRYLMPKLDRLVALEEAKIREASELGDERRNGLSETEQKYNSLYNSLKGQYGEQVDSWIEYAKRMNNKAQMAENLEKSRAFAEDKAGLASVGSIPLNMFSGAGYLDVVAQKMQRGITGSSAPIDYNSAAQSASKMTNEIRGTVSEDMSGVGSFLYNTAMSMGDTLVAMPMGGFGMALLGGSAATNAMQQAVDRGASDNQALAVGLLAGGMEAVMEKLSVDSLFNLKSSETARDVVFNVLKQAGAEGTEEALTTIANTLGDALVMGSKSELQTRIQNLIAAGNSPEAAEKIAMQEWGQGLLLDFAGGAFSGGVFGTGKSTYNLAINKIDAAMPKIQQTQTQQTEQNTPAETYSQNANNTAVSTPEIRGNEQAAQDAAVAATIPNMQQAAPIAAFQQTASEILNDGIFDSPTYGEALEQTGLKRSDVREALRTVARNNIAAANDPKVQTVLDAIKKVDAQPVQAQAEAPAQPVSEVASRVTGKNENTANTAPEMQVEVRRNEQDAQPAMGAADYGFSGPIGSWKRDADDFIKDTEIPKFDQKGRTISDSAGSMFSANVPNETKEYIERMSYLGKFNVGHDTNEAQVQRVHDAIAKYGFDDVYTKTITEIEDGKASGDLTARAWVLFVQAANRGDSAKAATLAKAINKNAGNSAHALQANAIYYKLSPEGRYASIARTVDKINEELSNEGRKGAELYDVPESDKIKVTKAIEDERETALRLLENIHQVFNRRGRNHGTPVELWSTEVGNQLASVLEKNKNPGSALPQTIAKALRRDLQIFAQNYMSKNAPAGTQYNAARALENFLNNREQYQEAWKQAQATLQEKYADDPAMLEALQDFMADEISLEQLEKGIDRDIAKAIREIGTKTSEIFKQSPDDRVVVGRQVVDMLMRDHQLSAEDAKTMSDFIMKRFFRQMNTELEKNRVRAEANREKLQQKKQREAEREAAREAKKHGVPVEDWLQEIGNEVAKVLGATPSAPNPKPISKTIKQDILRFATDYKPKKPVQKRTAMDTLTDFLANRDEYVRAWSAAREAYKAQYDADPEGFAGATMTFGGTGSDAVMTQAIVEEVTEQEVKNLGFNARTFLEGQNVRESQIADSIIKKTGASGADATMIRDAVSRYFNERFDSEKGRGSVDAKIQEKLHDIGMKMSDIIRSSPGDKTAVANRVASMMVKDYNISQADAQRLSASIIDRFNARMNEAAEEALKNYVKPKDKKAQKTLDKRFREMVNMGAFSGSNYADQVAEKLFGNVVKLDPDLIERYKNTTDPDEIRELEKEIYKSVGRQIPSNFKDKFNAWRHMSMLGTFKAPERNLLGNAAGVVMRKASNAVSSVGQLTLNKSERTRSVVPAGKELKQVAKNDIKNVEQELKGIGKNHIVNDQIEEARQIFTPHIANAVRKAFPELPERADEISLEGLRHLINKAMSDEMFSKPAYVDSLSSFLKARGYTAEDFTGDGMTEAQKAEAREHAIADALKATYRDMSVIAELVTNTRFKPDMAKSDFGKQAMEVANKGLEGIMPYLKTPANVLARGIEYDLLLGTATTIYKAAYTKKHGDYKATDLIDGLSKSLTGGAIAAIGYVMRAHNMIKGRSDDEEQDDLEGKSEYSLMIGGKAIPIDWMAPFCMPLFVGAEVYNIFNRDEDGDLPVTTKIASSLNTITSAIMNTSLLDGVQDMIDNVKCADSAPIALVANATLGYLGQYVPTLFGQLERAFNSPYAEQTYIYKADKVFDADWQRALGTLSKKIPGWDYNQIPYIDAWGRKTETGGFGKRLVNNLFNPANTSEIMVTEVDQKIRELEKEPGVNLTPARAQSVLTIDGKKIILTANEYVTYAQAKGQNDLTFRHNLMSSDAFNALDAETQGKAMEFSEDLAKALAIKETGFDDPDMDDWMAELIGADADTITKVLTERAIVSRAGTLGENKYLGLETLLENKSVDDQMALACLTKPQYDAYTNNCEETGVSVQQFLDIYGATTAYGKTGDKTDEEKRSFALDEITKLDLSPEQKGALGQAMYDLFKTHIPLENRLPADFLVGVGDIEGLETRMGEEESKKYNTYIKGSKVNVNTYSKFTQYCGSDAAKTEKDAAGNEIAGKTDQDKAVQWLTRNASSNEERARLYCTQFSENSCPKDWFIDAFGVEKAEEYINSEYREKYETYVKDKLSDPAIYFELEKYIVSDQEKADRRPGETKMDHIRRLIANENIPEEEKDALFCGFYAAKNCPRDWDEWKD